jgi:microcin C transport system ATP-binding protein
MSLLFITHDLGIVRRIADRVCVMKDGEIVEQGRRPTIFADPRIPTRRSCWRRAHGAPEAGARGARRIVSTDALRVWFPIQRGLLRRTVGHV